MKPPIELLLIGFYLAGYFVHYRMFTAWFWYSQPTWQHVDGRLRKIRRDALLGSIGSWLSVLFGAVYIFIQVTSIEKRKENS